MLGLRIIILTLLALGAFAANSILCRLALLHGYIDPVAFTQIRLVAGALILFPAMVRDRSSWWPLRPAMVRPALALFLYATGFSLAYVSLSAGTGALILFAAVQVSMIALSVLRGARPGLAEWIGFSIAFGGLVYLVAPGLSAPPLGAALLMAGAGVAWGIYSVLGRNESDPIAATARNFVFTVPLAVLLTFASPAVVHVSMNGILLAAASGAITSGLGYVAWYAALKGLPAMAASVVQLAVSPIAALGGILFLSEIFTLRLGVASVAILGGIFLAIWSGARGAANQVAGPSRMSR